MLKKLIKSDSSLRKTFNNYWPQLVLLFLLILLVIANLSPNRWLMGWDNFSSSLNLSKNILRTLSTWREYRGFGVATDSEIVDIFRLLILWVFDLFLPSILVEQFYYIIMMGVGVFGSFYLIRQVLLCFLENNKQEKVQYIIQISSFLGAIYYAVNRFALETFLFPTAMYVERYAFFPWMAFIIHKFVHQKKIILKESLAFIFVSLLTSTSYLTATLFFTFLIIVASFLFSARERILRLIMTFVLLIAFNSFWLLPFGNYYFQKAELIPKTSSFIEVNESLLNKPASEYSWHNLLFLYPYSISQSALPFTNLINGEDVTVTSFAHPFSQLSKQTQISLVFALLIISFGIIVVMRQTMQTKYQNAWLLALLISLLILLRKDLPPTGFIYTALTKIIPMFEVVFRFGSAKFFPLLLIVFSTLLGIGSFSLLQIIPRIKIKTVKYSLLVLGSVVPFLLLAIPYSSYLSGGLFHRLMKVDLPIAYEETAEWLDNQESGNYRLLHLPYDKYSYWKSYQWGYFGSSFINFQIKGSLLDRTFEPASPELDAYFATLTRLITGYQQLDSEMKENRVELISRLLKITNTNYLLYDESVGVELQPLGLQSWGVFASEEWDKVVKALEERGDIRRIKTTTIALPESDAKLILFEVLNLHTDYTPESAIAVDDQLEVGFIDPLLNQNMTFFQSNNETERLTFPLWQPLKKIQPKESGLEIKIPFAHNGNLIWQLKNEKDTQQIYEVYAREIGEGLEVSLKVKNSPFNNEDLSEAVISAVVPGYDQGLKRESNEIYLSNWHKLNQVSSENYRIKVGDTILPLPSQINQEPTLIGSVFLNTESAPARLIKLESKQQIEESSAYLTDNPNCFDDKTANYSYDFEVDQEVVVNTQNGMTCFTVPLINANDLTESFYYEVSFSASGIIHQETFNNSKLEPLNLIQGCIFNPTTGSCLNYRELLSVPADKYSRITLVSDQLITSRQNQLLMIIPNYPQAQKEVRIKDIELKSYVAQEEVIIDINSNLDNSGLTTQSSSTELILELPYVFSPDSYFYNLKQPDINYIPLPCEQGARFVGLNNDGFTRSEIQNCFQGLSVSLPYFDNRTYFWHIEVAKNGGRQPKFRVLQPDAEVKNEIISRYDLYPDMSEKKPYRVHTLFNAEGFIGSTDTLELELYQLAENKGGLELRNMEVMPLPVAWQDMSVANGNYIKSFTQLTQVEETKLLPSLWKISFFADSHQDGQVLLPFNQAFDSQWLILSSKSLVNLLFKREQLPATHVKVNGWSNGWIIDTKNLPLTGELYVFYWPELLTVLGWIITLFSMIGLLAVTYWKTRSQPTPTHLGKRVPQQLGGKS